MTGLDEKGHDIRNILGSDFEDRMKAARERARWAIGDPSWAELIIGAFLSPEADQEALRDEEAH